MNEAVPDDQPSTVMKVAVAAWFVVASVAEIALCVWAAANHGVGGFLLMLFIGAPLLFGVLRIVAMLLVVPFAMLASRRAGR
jgi:hypothetical protein